ncbi:hypothetical protein ACWOC1_10595 [Enterococcus quebecensis]|uniref:Septation ring formation regulator EzrA n=1 Tax=Enterococcus quebecensis TaxID=903983 RepID=A0A1E5H1G1_9ENTE|nr:hypothetical protein [Enterococcus quebecensis]OEG18838.1 hypothetical protein BCR23_12920 [Enterococcus quebecensis]
MGIIVLIVFVVGGALYFRRRTVKKVHGLMDNIDGLCMELEVAVRSGDFSSLEEIILQSEEIRKTYPFLARFGDFKPLRAEFLNLYNQLLTQIDSVHRELEVQRRVKELS